MKILSPIDRPGEAEALIAAGADELYGGFVSGAWRKKYSMLASANHRYFRNAQFESGRALKAEIRAAHGRGAKFYIAMNAPYYMAAQYADLVDEAARILDMGADALIISDIGLILRVREKFPEASIHLSTLGAVFNSASARFFGGLGVGRIVLPRELSICEIKGIVRANPGLSFDSFIMVGKCPNIEGFCTFTHNNPELVWPCEEEYEMRILSGDGRASGIIEAQRGWSRVNRRQACGLCAVRKLEKAGVSALKIVGRGGPTEAKLKMVAAVKKIMELSISLDDKDLREAAKDTYKDLFGRPCNPYICYFPIL